MYRAAGEGVVEWEAGDVSAVRVEVGVERVRRAIRDDGDADVCQWVQLQRLVDAGVGVVGTAGGAGGAGNGRRWARQREAPVGETERRLDGGFHEGLKRQTASEWWMSEWRAGK